MGKLRCGLGDIPVEDHTSWYKRALLPPPAISQSRPLYVTVLMRQRGGNAAAVVTLFHFAPSLLDHTSFRGVTPEQPATMKSLFKKTLVPCPYRGANPPSEVDRFQLKTPPEIFVYTHADVARRIYMADRRQRPTERPSKWTRQRKVINKRPTREGQPHSQNLSALGSLNHSRGEFPHLLYLEGGIYIIIIYFLTTKHQFQKRYYVIIGMAHL